jgi:hypothetical protein
MSTSWQEDWDGFVDLLAGLLRKGATTRELTDQFGGKVITWSGVLERKNLDHTSPSVSVDVPERQLDIGEGTTVPLSGLSLPVAEDAVGDWNRLENGSRLTFTATLGSQGSPFGPVEVMRLQSGRHIIMIRLVDGRPGGDCHGGLPTRA